MPDPKLKTAMAEIEAVLDKHDIAGMVAIQSPEFAEYLVKIDPTWSCAWLETQGDGGTVLRFRARLADYGGDKAALKTVKENTAGMLIGFHDQAERWRDNMLRAMAMMGKQMAIEHRSIDET